MKKFAWYGSSVALAALLAVTLLVTGGSSAFAAASVATATAGTAGSTAATLSVADTDLAAGEIVIFTIIGGTGTGSFTSGGGQTLACADATATGTCDTDTAAGTVKVSITGATAGTLLVQYAVYDGSDGVSGLNGSSAVANVTIANPISSVVVTTSGGSAAAQGGEITVTATVTDAAGVKLPSGSVTFSTTSGIFAAASGNSGCSAGEGGQVCTAAINNNADDGEAGEAAGTAIVVLQGAGLTGTATITATVGANSGTKTVTFSGATSTITVATMVDADGADAGTTGVAAASPNAATSLLGNGFWVAATLKDVAGNPVAGVTPTTSNVTAGATIPTCTASSSTGVSVCAVTAITAAAGTTINYTVNVGTKSATGSFVVGGATPATVEVTAPGIEPTTVGTITALVKDAAGNLIADGTSVTLVVTEGALVNSTAMTASGVASFTYVSPGTPQTVNATALVGGKTGSANFNVGVGAGEGEGDGSFTGDIADAGVSIVSFDGGTVADLADAAGDAGLTSVWVTVDGDFVGYIVGAPAFVNAAFNAQFADGIDAGTLAIVVK